MRHEAYITGVGQSQVGVKLTRHPLLLTLDAIKEALQEANLTISQIDGVSTYPGRMGPMLGFSPLGAEDLIDALREAGKRADDRAWPMPIGEEYAEGLKSNFADFANVAGREGGAITAACFLAKFTDGLRWAHLDIAGTAYVGGSQKGSTGRPVPMLVDYLLNKQ